MVVCSVYLLGLGAESVSVKKLMNSCVSILKRNSKKKMKSRIRQQLSVTSPEQSLRLFEVGYTIDTADMVWIKHHYCASSVLQEKENAENYPTDSYDILPAWSLLRLYQMLPPYLQLLVNEDNDEWNLWNLKIDKDNGVAYVDNSGKYEYVGEIRSMSPIDNLVNAFVGLAEKGWLSAVEEEFDNLPEIMK